MIKLLEEYTDIKSVRHRVEHTTLSWEYPAQQERLMAELTCALNAMTNTPT
ncbi:MAG: hypothetical protein Q3Y08_03850 [Butyricicoccus sp.]|nr:hypothetical protein [Butyricicoccus sp.]